jgi:hypothetical protein
MDDVKTGGFLYPRISSWGSLLTARAASGIERMFLQEIREIMPLLSFKFSVLAFFLEVSS